MRVDRMLTILVVLLRRGRVQAKELASLLEVSLRTIYRDIEAINLAGIPIVAWQGGGGGFEIAEGYRLDSGVFSSQELATIVTALGSVAASVDDKRMAILAEKFKNVVPPEELAAFNSESQQLFVDLSPWNWDKRLQGHLELGRRAIAQCRLLEFTYRKPQQVSTRRRVEPHTLVLKGQNWYLYAYCREREDFRLFRVSRMRDVAVGETTFPRREVTMSRLSWQASFAGKAPGVMVTLRFRPQAWAVAMDWFQEEEGQRDAQGRVTVQATIPEADWLVGYLLSFGDGVEVLAPERVRLRVGEMARRLAAVYSESADS